MAAYTSGGRLWTAWWNAATKRYEATLGSASGAGGRIVRLGKPVSSGDAGPAAAIASSNNLVLVVNWIRGKTSSRFVNVVAEKLSR